MRTDWICPAVFASALRSPRSDSVRSSDGKYLEHMEPFREHTKFVAPIDLELGPDGRLYVLEYGLKWFAKNPEAMLSRIDYKAAAAVP